MLRRSPAGQASNGPSPEMPSSGDHDERGRERQARWLRRVMRQEGCWARLAASTGLLAAAGAILGSGSQGPLQRWSSAAWVVFAGVSLAWFQEIQLECDRGSFFQTRRANSLLSALLQWRLHLALVLALAGDGTRGLVPLLLWLLPALVAHGLGHARPGHATAAASPFLRAQSSRSMARGELLDLARAAAGEVLGMAPASVPVDVSLAGGLGLDSAGALIFRDSLERHLGPGVRLPAALVFEHPTLLQLA
ncbi:unnamed protein product, partial [Polarella glacialis]